MKQLRIALLAAVFFYGYGIFSQSIVSLDIEKKNPVVFDFTGIHCVSCPHAHEAIAYAKNHYPQVVAMAFHTGNFAVPGAGEPDFRTFEGDSIESSFAFWKPDAGQYRVVWSYPTVCVNAVGVENNVGTDTLLFLQKIEEVIAEDATVNIGAVAYIDTLKRKMKVEVECYYTSAATDSNYLVVSVTQNGLKSTQAGAGDDYEHKEMFRLSVSNIYGDTLGIPEQGDLIQKTYYFDLPDSIKHQDGNGVELVLQNIQVQAYIQGGDTLVTAYDFIGVPYKKRRAFEILNGVNAEKEYTNLNGIFKTKYENSFSIYPNPANDFVSIKTLRNIDVSTVEILDIYGGVLSVKPISDAGKIPLDGLDEGIYIIRLVFSNGIIASKKFIVR